MLQYLLGSKLGPRLTFLFIILISLSCGIDSYTYLEPVRHPIISVSEKRTFFRLPSNQDPIYCTNYSIYYRIYKGRVEARDLVTGNYSNFNSQLSTDFSKIYTHTEDEREILSSITYLEDNFFQLALYFPPQKTLSFEMPLQESQRTLRSRAARLNQDGEILEDSIDIFDSSVQFVLDFLLLGDYYHPVLKYKNTGLRLARQTVSDFKPGIDFLFPRDISGEDVVPYSSTEEGIYACVLFYIVAEGTDDFFSPIRSAPAFLGLFEIEDPL